MEKVLLGGQLHATVIRAVLGVGSGRFDAARPQALSDFTAVSSLRPLTVPHLVPVFLLRFVLAGFILLFLVGKKINNRKKYIEKGHKGKQRNKKIINAFCDAPSHIVYVLPVRLAECSPVCIIKPVLQGLPRLLCPPTLAE